MESKTWEQMTLDAIVAAQAFQGRFGQLPEQSPQVSSSITRHLGTGTTNLGTELSSSGAVEAPVSPKAHWCVTAYPPDDISGEEGYLWLQGWLMDREVSLTDFGKVRYAVFGHEVCPETKRAHLQGYIELRQKARLSGVKVLLDDCSVHLEARAGTREQARDYCKKDGDFREYGEWIVGRGARTDLVEAYGMLKSGASLRELLDAQPANFMRYHHGFAKAKQLLGGHGPERPDVEVHVFWGESGTGKTRMGEWSCKKRVEAKACNGYWKRSNNKDWFTTYDGEEAVLFDDFTGDGSIPFDKLLMYLDRYPCTVPVHGGVVAWHAKYIVITSNRHPRDWYRLDEYNVGQLQRRLTSITEVVASAGKPASVWQNKPKMSVPMDLS